MDTINIGDQVKLNLQGQEVCRELWERFGFSEGTVSSRSAKSRFCLLSNLGLARSLGAGYTDARRWIHGRRRAAGFRDAHTFPKRT